MCVWRFLDLCSFSYLPNGITDKTFLGQVVSPQELTLQNLQTSPQNRGAHAIANSGLFDNFLKHSVRFAGDETFSRALGDTFLHPLGIDSLKRFFTLNQKSVDNILTRNSKMNENDFYQVRSGRPFLIVGSTLVRPKNKFHFETTPLYAGIRVLHAGAGSKEAPACSKTHIRFKKIYTMVLKAIGTLKFCGYTTNGSRLGRVNSPPKLSRRLVN